MQKGGAERVISLILKDFIKDTNLNLHLVMMENGIEYNIPSSINTMVLSKNKKNGVQKFLELPFIAWKISKYIKENDIDIVMSFLYRPNYINILAKLFRSKHKIVINIRSTTSRYLNEGLLGKVNIFLIKMLFNKSDLIISNSFGVDKDLKSLMNISTNTRVVYNPFDLKDIALKKNVCQDMKFDFKNNIKYIISVGRLIPLKRNKDLINAFYILQKDDSNLELIFLGDGILKKKLQKICQDLNISKKVYFLGNVRNPFFYLNNSDLFVMNSEIEGFPNVLVEAMACGLPVISSNCKSGPKEILENGKYGLLYPVGNVNILIEKMQIYLYNNLNKSILKENNFKRVKDFNINKILKEYKEAIGV